MANRGEELIVSKFSKKFEEYNTNTLKKIAETINQFKDLSYSEAHKLAQQLKYDKSYTDLIDDLVKLTNQSKKEIKGMLEEEAKQNIEFADTYYKAKNLDTPIFEESNVLKDIVNANKTIAGEDFSNISRSTGFRLIDNDGNTIYSNMKDTYFKAIDESVYAVSQGKDNFNNVMRNLINQLAESGVRKIEYSNDGKAVYSQRLDTAVRRNILDSIRQVSNETQIELGKEIDADGVEITVHDNPAPDHADVQGRQFSFKEYAKLQAGKPAKDFKGNIHQITHSKKGGYRQISQYNCYHKILSINLGIDEPMYTDEELQEIQDINNQQVEIDGKLYTKYEATQLQRQLETEIRKSKDKHIMFKETGDTLGMLKEQKRITQLTKKYKEVSNKADIREQLNRARVSGYRRVSVKNLEENNNKIEFKEVNDEMLSKMDKKSKLVAKNISITDFQPLYNYATRGYQEMAETITEGEPRDMEVYKSVDDIKKDINTLENFLNKHEVLDDIIAYKGTSNNLYKDYNIGDEFTIDVFNGVSAKETIANKFGQKAGYLKGDNKAILQIRIPKGTKGLYLGDNFTDQNEYEILLNRGLKYKLISKEEIDPSGYEDGIYVHKLKYYKYILEVIK